MNHNCRATTTVSHDTTSAVGRRASYKKDISMPPVTTTRMTFDDEFSNFSASDSGIGTTWQTRLPYDGSAGYTLSGNDEAEYYSDPTSDGTNPFSVNNGVLSITA